MKKIGILTFHNAMSYGAVLQAYALQQSLHKVGAETEFINYMCMDIYNAHVRILPKTKNLKFNLKMLLMGRKRYKWRSLLENFRRQYLTESQKVDRDGLQGIGEKYSKVVDGSDQVFNDVCTGFDKTYFLDFVPDEKKYTYAASFGFNTLPVEKREAYHERLKGFQRLSIREESGCKIVESVVDTIPECHIDPTFLLPKEEWEKIVIEPKRKKPYILVFSVLKPVHMIDYALKLGREKDCEVLYLENYAFPKKKGLHYIGPVAPNEFIGLIKNAEYIVTNSFHGMAFSIMYQKKFIVELNTSASRNYRCADLLAKLGIKNNELVEGKVEIEKAQYNWEKVQCVIEQEREKSLEYLKSITESE